MSRTVEEREIDIFGREVKETWKGPWCSQGDFWVRHVFTKRGVLIREVYRAFPAKGGIHYHELPE